MPTIEEPGTKVAPTTGIVTVTEADRGQVIADNGVLVRATLKKSPTDYTVDYLSIARGDRVGFHLHISTSPVGVDSILFSGSLDFENNLTLVEIPPGCEVELWFAESPILTSLSPDTAVSGGSDFELSCIGTGFTDGTIIRFGPDYDEPTNIHVSGSEVKTIVKPSLFAPAVVPVCVHTGHLWSNWVDFTFTEPVEE